MIQFGLVSYQDHPDYAKSLVLIEHYKKSKNVDDAGMSLLRAALANNDGIGKAVLDNRGGVHDVTGVIHGLKSETRELQILELHRLAANLRVDQLQLIARLEHQVGADLRADAHPVEAARCGLRAVGLHGHVEALFVKSLDGLLVELE